MTRHLSQNATILESKWPGTQKLKNKVQVKMTRNPSQSEIILKSKWPEIQRFKSKISQDD